MIFFLNMMPPTVTGQMKRVHYVKGKPVFFKSDKQREAEQQFTERLSRFAPKEPMQGAVLLQVRWYFPKGKSHEDYDWKTTRPDTDNLEKTFKDCMTKVGFWKDDAQVACEIIQKRWAKRPGIWVLVEELGMNTDIDVRTKEVAKDD